MVLKENDVLKCPPFPLLTFKGFSWTAELNLDYWRDCLTRVDLFHGKTSHDGSVSLSLTPLKKSPSPEQVQAYQYFLENSDSVFDSLLKAVFDSYPAERASYREGYGWSEDLDEDEKEEFEDDYGIFVPELFTPQDLKKVICLRIIHVGAEALNGFSYIGFEFDCNWDEEHGLGVLMHRDRVVSVGQADVSFGSADEPNAIDLNDLYGPPDFDESSITAGVEDVSTPEQKAMMAELMKRKGLL